MTFQKGSFSLAVVNRILKILEVHGTGINRTNLAGKTGLNYGTCIRYVDLLVFLRWATLSQVQGNLVYLTRTGREFIYLLERTGSGSATSDEKYLVDFLAERGIEKGFMNAPTDSVLDRHRLSDYASNLGEQDDANQKGLANIMIIEDELDVLLTYEVLLVEQGFNVYAFSDPRLALEAFAKNVHHIDLVITDIRMNSINGIQLYMELKSIDPDIRIVLVSALDAAPEITSVLPGFKKEHFIPKPVDQAKLAKTIHAALVGKVSVQRDAIAKQQGYN